MIRNLMPLAPLVLLAGASVLAVFLIAVRRNLKLTFGVTLGGILLSAAAVLVSSSAAPRSAGFLFLFDGFALFFQGLILSAGFAVAVLARDYRGAEGKGREEMYVLLLLALLGAAALVGSTHFVSFFLGLEVLSISLYSLIAYRRSAAVYTEAGLKYLVLSAVSSSFLLFGMALLYGLTGSMEFGIMAKQLPDLAGGRIMSLAALVLLVIGVGFKLALVPFHMWTPDVYQGAPAPVTAFIATVSKGAVFALLMRYFTTVDLLGHPRLFFVFTVIAVLSMFVGNLLALFQANVKRLLAYSSIAHFGYLLVAFLSLGPLRISAVAFYLVAYFVTTLGAFAVVSTLSVVERDADAAEDYEGLFRRRPWIAGIFTLMLLSLAGMPLTAGFIGKIYIVAAGVGSLLWFPVLALVVNSAIGLFYYLRIIALMFGPGMPGGPVTVSIGLGSKLLLCVLLVLLVWWGVYPAPLISLIETVKMAS